MTRCECYHQNADHCPRHDEESEMNEGTSAQPMSEAKRERLGQSLWDMVRESGGKYWNELNASEKFHCCAAAEAIYRQGYDAAVLGMEC